MSRIDGTNLPAHMNGKTALDAGRDAECTPGECARVSLTAKAAEKNIAKQWHRGTPKVPPVKIFAIWTAGEITDYFTVRLGDIGPIRQLFFVGLDPYSNKKLPTLRRDRRAIIACAATKRANRVPNSSLGFTIYRKSSYCDWSRQTFSTRWFATTQARIVFSRPTYRALRRCAQLDIGQPLK